MESFEDFLSEGKKLQIKRKYTENHPAHTVGKTANVRNAVLKAVADGVITEDEFVKILSELSGDHKQWRTRNKKYFFVSEEGIRLSKWGLRILNELDSEEEELVLSDEVNENAKILKDKWPYVEFKLNGKKHKVDFEYEDDIDDHGNEGKDQYYRGEDEDGNFFEVDVYSDYRGEVQDVLYDTLVQVDESLTENKDLEKKKVTENKDMKKEFNLFESFGDFLNSEGILNEAINSAILRSVLSNGREGKEGKRNLSMLAKGFYGLSKVALDRIEDEDFIISNDVSKIFKNYGGDSHVLFFISDNEKENRYYDTRNSSYNDYRMVPGGGIVLAAMSGDRQFYSNEWSRWAGGRTWSKNKKGDESQIGISHKYRGWGASGLSNGKRIAEVSDRVIVINLELIRQK